MVVEIEAGKNPAFFEEVIANNGLVPCGILMVQLAGPAQQEKKLRREVCCMVSGELLGQERVFVVFLKDEMAV